MTPSCDSIMVSLDMNDLKYCPSRPGVIASSTLRNVSVSSKYWEHDMPPVFIVSWHFYHIPQCENKPLQRFILFVFYYNDHLVDVSLPASSKYAQVSRGSEND